MFANNWENNSKHSPKCASESNRTTHVVVTKKNVTVSLPLLVATWSRREFSTKSNTTKMDRFTSDEIRAWVWGRCPQPGAYPAETYFREFLNVKREKEKTIVLTSQVARHRSNWNFTVQAVSLSQWREIFAVYHNFPCIFPTQISATGGGGRRHFRWFQEAYFTSFYTWTILLICFFY